MPPHAVELAVFTFTPEIVDPDGDAVIVSAQNLPAWLNVDPQTGQLTGTPSTGDIGTTRNVSLSANDAQLTTTLSFDLTVDPEALEQALRSADHTLVDDEQVYLNAIIDTVDSDAVRFNAARKALLNLNADGTANGDSLTAISWDPSHDTALLESSFGLNTPILTTNAVTSAAYTPRDAVIGIVGEKPSSEGGSRYLVLGSSPMRSAYQASGSVNDEMHKLVTNSIAWLTKNPGLENLKIAIAQMGQEYYFPDQVATRAWLDTNLPDSIVYNAAGTCDGEALAGCLSGNADLLIISQRLRDSEDSTAIRSTVDTAMRNGTPVLYLHFDGSLDELGKELLPLFDVHYAGDNYWSRLQVTNLDQTVAPAMQPPLAIRKMRDLIVRLKDDTFTIDLSVCEDKSCPPETNYASQFEEAVKLAQASTNALNAGKSDIFARTAAYRYQKLVILLADHYRQQVRFPMDKDRTPRPEFIRALFADHIVYTNRDRNPAQTDMGNFSRSDFSHITPRTIQIDLNSTKGFRTSGTYALPGQTVSVTRLDASDVETWVRINSVRTGSTHLFEPDGYKRPIYTTSEWVQLISGETIRLTSPYGGPVHVWFDDKELPVSFSFAQVGQHPFWKGPEDTAMFTAALAANEYDWAELVTPGFEVHSKIDKMQESIDNPMWGSAAALATASQTYLQNYPHVLAGLQGPGIDIEPEVHNFAALHGLSIATLDTPKHMNADQASCGYGCSGNPYDAYWSFDPLGHGDLHELGHGLERGRIRFEGHELHASTNPYSYFSKYNYFLNTGDQAGTVAGCQALPFERLYQHLQASLASPDPGQFMRNLNLTNWSEGVAILIQAMASAQNEGTLANGWLLLARLHLIEREFGAAAASDTAWAAKAAGMGFNGMSRADASGLGNNDWLLITTTHATGRDMTDYLSMWGFPLSTTARNHVASFGYTAMPRSFYAMQPTDHCLGLNRTELDVDAMDPWTPAPPAP